MKWKLFACAMAASLAYGLLNYEPQDIVDLVAIPIDIIASIGVITYAFRLQRSQARLWTPFAWFFAGWSVLSLGWGTFRGSANGSPVYAIVGAVLIAGLLSYINWLALNRLGCGQPA
jgi:hypothetical protein